MKKLSLFLMLIFFTVSFSQTINYTFSGLRGMEDKNGNTHLFYWKYYFSGNDTNYNYSNNIYHLDLSNGYDTLFLIQNGSSVYPFDSYSRSINDFEFWDNNPAKFIFCGVQCGTDCVFYILRYDYKNNAPGFSRLGPPITSIFISNQNDSLLYAGSTPILTSTDGGWHWNPIDSLSGYNFFALNPYNDKSIYLLKALASSTYFDIKMYILNHGNMSYSLDVPGNRYVNLFQLKFDRDSLHLYLYDRVDSTYSLMVSSNSGEANSWTKKYSSTNNIYLSIDDSTSGTIYLADGNKILLSTDYGNTFNVYKTFDSTIVGIYKKPNSDLLYAATKYDIYEITSSTIKSIKHLITAIDYKGTKFPKEFILYQNYPNPFNPSTTIKYSIPSTNSPLQGGAGGGLVTLKVFDILGREVATLVNEYQTAGEYSVQFTTTNNQLPSGVYFYQLKVGDYLSIKKMILMK